MHTEMTLNIIVPIGSILFNFIDLREKSGELSNSDKTAFR